MPQGLVGVQLGRARGDLRQTQRRKLQRPLPTLRAHLVRGQVPAQLVRAEHQGQRRFAALPCLDEPAGVRQQISQEEKHRPFPGEARRAAAQQRDGASSDVRGERREGDLGYAPQARHRLGRELDRQLLRLAMHVAEQRLWLRIARRPRPCRPMPAPSEHGAFRSQPAREPRSGQRRADREQVEKQATRGVQRRRPHLLPVDQQAGSDHPRRRGQRHQREQQIVTARFQHEFRRSRTDGGLRRRLALADADQRLRQLVDRLQHARFADASRDVDSVDLDAQHVEDVRAREALGASAAQRAKLAHIRGVEAPRSPGSDTDHCKEAKFVDTAKATQ